MSVYIHVDYSYNNTNIYTQLLLYSWLLHDILTNHMSHWIYTLTNATVYRKPINTHSHVQVSTQPNNTRVVTQIHTSYPGHTVLNSSFTDPRTHSPLDTQSPGHTVRLHHTHTHTVPLLHLLLSSKFTAKKPLSCPTILYSPTSPNWSVHFHRVSRIELKSRESS